MCCMELALKATLRISQADKSQWEGKSCSYLPKVSGYHYPDDMAGRMHCCTGHPVGFCSVWFLAFLVLFTENQLTWQEVSLFLAAYALRVTWSVREATSSKVKLRHEKYIDGKGLARRRTGARYTSYVLLHYRLIFAVDTLEIFAKSW